jgi:hypothetical protein
MPVITDGKLEEIRVDARLGEMLAWSLTYDGSIVLFTLNLRNQETRRRVRLPFVLGAGRKLTLCDVRSSVTYTRTQEEWGSAGCVFRVPAGAARIWVDADTHRALSESLRL